MALVMALPRSAHRRRPARCSLFAAMLGGVRFAAHRRARRRPSLDGPGSARADAPVALTEVAVAAHDGRIWVAGGLTAERRRLDRGVRLRPGDGCMDRGPDLPGARAPLDAGQRRRRRCWLVGGYAGNGFDAPTAEVGGSTTAASTGSHDPPLPEPRAAGAAAWDGSRIVYAGGVEPGGVSGAVFAFEDGAWSQVARLAKPREHLAATSDGEGGMYVSAAASAGWTAISPRPTWFGARRRRRSASCRRRAAVSQRSGGRPSVRASSAGSHRAARTRRSNASTRTATSRCCPGSAQPRHGLGAAVVDRRGLRRARRRSARPVRQPDVEALELP